MSRIIEWSQGVYRFIDDVGKGGEEYASYLVLGDDQIALIDIPTRSLGKDIISYVKKIGRDPSAIKYLVLTHSHPDHWAGIDSLAKIKPEIWIHEAGIKALTEGQKYILQTQFHQASRFSLAMKSSLFSKISKIDEKFIHPFSSSETLELGGESLILQHTGGHSADSILIQAYRGQCTFIGDEGNIYPDQPAAFYLDATGDSKKRLKLLELLKNVRTEVICPSHQSPVPKPTDMYIHNLIFEHNHTKDTLYDLLLSVGQSKVHYLSEEYQNTLGISWKTPFDELGVAETTVTVFMNELKKEGKVDYESHNERWKVV
ncbi:MAG: MBL fold metallo-hydrolase [Candidatus Heimdallarchaeota archaeon]|nr:MBL fold metallo-hydrolase [Candidatus Heimdallarchaeota archaeon]